MIDPPANDFPNRAGSGDGVHTASDDVALQVVQESLSEASDSNTSLSFATGLPLYGLSRLAYVSAQKTLHGLAQLSENESQSWERLDEMLDAPLALPYIMVTGPRWNTHALIASAGPFEVERRLVVDTRSLQGANWYAVLHRLPSNTCVQWADHSTSTDGAPLTFRVQPGKYSIVVRLYPSDVDLTLPSVSIDDGTTAIPERFVGSVDLPQSHRQFGHRSAFYDLLHHHTFFLLHHADCFDHDMVRRRYLPVGNPGTSFAYGAVTPGKTVTVRWTDALQQTHSLFLTAYNRSSFPMYSASLTPRPGEDSPYQVATPEFDEAATFLLRIVPRPAPHSSVAAQGRSRRKSLASEVRVRTEETPSSAARTIPSLPQQAERAKH